MLCGNDQSWNLCPSPALLCLPLGSRVSWRADSDCFWEAKPGIRWTVSGSGFGVGIGGLSPWLIGTGSYFLVTPGSFHLLDS